MGGNPPNHAGEEGSFKNTRVVEFFPGVRSLFISVRGRGTRASVRMTFRPCLRARTTVP